MNEILELHLGFLGDQTLIHINGGITIYLLQCVYIEVVQVDVQHITYTAFFLLTFSTSTHTTMDQTKAQEVHKR